MKIAYRHGDVLLFKVEERPRLGNRISSGVLAYGEVTGHSHCIIGDYELFDAVLGGQEEFDKNGARTAMLLHVKTSAALTHEEHHAIGLPPGDYIVMTEAEYEPSGWRNVQD